MPVKLCVPTYFLSGAPTTDPTQIQTRLDMQVLDLPSSFDGDTIASVQFEGTDIAGSGDGEAFLAGLTLFTLMLVLVVADVLTRGTPPLQAPPGTAQRYHG